MSEMDPIRLDWEGPFKIRELIEPSARAGHLDQPGVYLWCDSDPRSICYVGRSKSSLVARQREHYLHQLSMEYSLPASARESRQKWECYWQLPAVLATVLDKQKVVEHIKEAFEYVHGVEVYLAVLDAADVERVERQLLWELQPSGTRRGTGTAPSEHTPITHSGSDWRFAVSQERRSGVPWI